jgi:tRNA 2-selenouridine synthase
VYVESESKKVGNLRVPEALIGTMRSSQCVRLEAQPAVRVALLLEDYAHFVADPASLAARLELLADLHGAQRIEQWQAMLSSGAWQPLVHDLLESHYDPAYRRSLFRNYREAETGPVVEVHDISRAGFLALATDLIRADRRPIG